MRFMSIFTKPITEITYDDVVSFCQQGIREGVNLDYKEDFPNNLQKSISAFANTFGGIILIGVVEDEDNKPKPPFEGINYIAKLEDRVWNIILDNIYPPLFPQVWPCPPKDNKTFVIIRIPQSNETPHAIYNNTQVYIRTGNRNKPEDLATIEQIDWLKNRRQKSEEFRETLYRRAEERYENICKTKKVSIEFGEFTLSFSPLYSQKPLILELNEIEDISRKTGVPLPYTKHISAQDSMIFLDLDEKSKELFKYTEINRFGLVFYKGGLGCNSKEEGKFISMYGIMQILYPSLERLGRFYKHIGYWGLIECVFSLNKLLGVNFYPPSPFRGFTENYVDNQLSWRFETSVAALNDPITRQNKLVELGKEIAWSFDFDVSEEIIIQNSKEWQRQT